MSCWNFETYQLPVMAINTVVDDYRKEYFTQSKKDTP